MAALDTIARLGDHVVTKVIEAEFGVGPVGDIGLVRGNLLGWLHAVLNQADLHAHEAVDAPHPFAVALGQVVVDRDDVHVVAGKRVEVPRQRGDERLALASLHLGNLAGVEGHATDELNVEVTQAKRALAGFAHRGKRLGQDLVERLAVFGTFAELVGKGAQLFVVELFHLGLQAIDAVDDALELLELAVFAKRENL